jgi:hypothetical protein
MTPLQNLLELLENLLFQVSRLIKCKGGNQVKVNPKPKSEHLT